MEWSCSGKFRFGSSSMPPHQLGKRHRWVGSNGPVSHVDLWEEILSLLAVYGHEVHWLQVPSHIGIRGNHKADESTDVGRQKSPLLFGHISVNIVGSGRWGGRRRGI